VKPLDSIVVECHLLAQALGIDLAPKIHVNLNKWNLFIILEGFCHESFKCALWFYKSKNPVHCSPLVVTWFYELVSYMATCCNETFILVTS
jgi:hypothetical protein